jgi:phospholipid/cholesterol/gamma-HCH transport system substrate-binding protein
METRANYFLIGLFTIAVVAGAVGFVLWFQSVHTAKMRTPLRIVFEGSASGLRNGGNVNFNGVRVGEVISVKLDNPRRVVALAMVENSAPIRKDTLVGLEFQGLTGVAAISLKGGQESAPPVPLDEDGVPMLVADPNALQDVAEAFRATLKNINRMVAENETAVKGSLQNVQTFTDGLARSAEHIDSIMRKTDSMISRTDSIMLGLDALAGGKDGGELLQAVKSVKELADNLDKRSSALILDGRRTLADISRAVNNLDRNPTRILFGPSAPEPQPAQQQRLPGPRRQQ